MKWYVVIKIFLVVYTTYGPFDTKDQCITQMIQDIDEAKARYNAGERVNVFGKEVSPKDVKAQCQLR